MENVELIALTCKISSGAFSDERVFEIEVSNGQEPYIGAAPRQYCWDIDGKTLGAGEPSPNKKIAGRIAARLLDTKGETALVSIPDGEVILVSTKLIKKRPESARNVPVKS